MEITHKNIGLAITGSFCTFANIYDKISKLISCGANIIPIFSYNASSIDTRFGAAKEWQEKFETLTGNKSILTIPEAEPIGPKNLLDILVIAPCTGNTLGKLANAITDTPVLMAAKSHIRNEKPIVIGLSSNDALAMNAKNLGALLNSKHYYFIPFGQDNPQAKKSSMISNFELMIPTIEMALDGKQLQPIIIENF